MIPTFANDFDWNSLIFGSVFRTEESYAEREIRRRHSGKPSAARVTTEPKIIVHPPVYGGEVKVQLLAIGNE